MQMADERKQDFTALHCAETSRNWQNCPETSWITSRLYIVDLA